MFVMPSQRLESLAEDMGEGESGDDEDYHQYCCKQSSLFRVRVRGESVGPCNAVFAS